MSVLVVSCRGSRVRESVLLLTAALLEWVHLPSIVFVCVPVVGSTKFRQCLASKCTNP